MLYTPVNFSDQIEPLNVFRFVTFRTGGAFMIALLMVSVNGSAVMDRLHRSASARVTPHNLTLASTGLAILLWCSWSSGYVWIALAVLMIVGPSSTLRAIDAQDGRYSALVMLAAVMFGILAYASGNPILARALCLPHIQGAAELTVACGAVIGAGFGVGSLRDA